MKRLIQYRIPLIEKWLTLPKFYHWGFFFFCVSAVNFSVVLESWQTYQKGQLMEQEIAQKQAEQTHQDKLLATLKQHSEKHVLSPKLTKQIIDLDQTIHTLMDAENSDLTLQGYQWDFSSQPILQIQAEGRFHDLHAFLQALSAVNSLAVAQLELQKMDSGQVHGQVILQLKREE